MEDIKNQVKESASKPDKDLQNVAQNPVNAYTYGNLNKTKDMLF